MGLAELDSVIAHGVDGRLVYFVVAVPQNHGASRRQIVNKLVPVQIPKMSSLGALHVYGVCAPSFAVRSASRRISQRLMVVGPGFGQVDLEFDVDHETCSSLLCCLSRDQDRIVVLSAYYQAA